MASRLHLDLYAIKDELEIEEILAKALIMEKKRSILYAGKATRLRRIHRNRRRLYKTSKHWMISRHNQKQGPMSLNEKGTSISYYIRLKRKSFALKIQIMTQGWPAGRMGWQSPWCRSTLFSYKTLLFPAKTVFWCFGVFKEADTRKRLFFLFLFLFYYTRGGLLAETLMTSRLDSWDNK